MVEPWERDGVERRRVEVAVQAARKYIEDSEWAQRADVKAKRVLGPQLYRRSQAGWAKTLCDEVNSLAEWLLGMSSKAKKMVSRTVRPPFAWIGIRKLEKLIADKFAEHVVDSVGKTAEAKIVIVANALRVYGVLICVQAGRDISHCACLRALATSKFEEAVKERVEQVLGPGLDQLVG